MKKGITLKKMVELIFEQLSKKEALRRYTPPKRKK
jgi:hypothetical protein